MNILLLLVSAALLCVVAAEVYLRIRYRRLLWINVYPQVYVPDDALGYRYRPNAEGEIRIAGIHRRFRTNSRGFNAREFAPDKPEGTYRIAIIGPSNTTGIWMDGEGRNFSQMLEEKFAAVGRSVEVMNFGIDGRYRSVHELRLLDTDVAGFHPDLVMLDVELPFVYGEFRRDVYRNHVMIYDAESNESRLWCELTVDYALKHTTLIRLYRLSYIVRAVARYYMNRYRTGFATAIRVFVENRIQAPDIRLMPYSLKRSVEHLKAAERRLAERGTRMLLFQYYPNQYFRHVAARYELPYMELDVPPIPQYVHDLDGHYRHAGHVAVAEQMHQYLVWSGLLDAAAPEPAAAPASTPEVEPIQNPEVIDDQPEDVPAAGVYGLA